MHNRHRDTGRVALRNDPALLVVRPEPACPTRRRNLARDCGSKPSRHKGGPARRLLADAHHGHGLGQMGGDTFFVVFIQRNALTAVRDFTASRKVASRNYLPLVRGVANVEGLCLFSGTFERRGTRPATGSVSRSVFPPRSGPRSKNSRYARPSQGLRSTGRRGRTLLLVSPCVPSL